MLAKHVSGWACEIITMKESDDSNGVYLFTHSTSCPKFLRNQMTLYYRDHEIYEPVPRYTTETEIEYYSEFRMPSSFTFDLHLYY